MHPAAQVADEDDEDGVADLQRAEGPSETRGCVLTHPQWRPEVTVPRLGNAKRKGLPRVSWGSALPESLTEDQACAVSALPHCQKLFSISVFEARSREVSRDDENLIALIQTILGSNLSGQNSRMPLNSA